MAGRYWKLWGAEGFDRCYPYTVEAYRMVFKNGCLAFYHENATEPHLVLAPSGYSRVEPSDWAINQHDYFAGEK